MFKLYKITNTVNGKLYVGITKLSLDQRWAKHLKDSQNPKYPLHRAIKKHGSENFSIELLKEDSNRDVISSSEEPTILELDSRKNGYNVAKGGYGGDLGPEANLKRKQTILSRTPEERQAISEKLSKAQTGLKRSTETKQRLSELQKLRGGYGPKKHSEETKEKMSLASKGKEKPQSTRKKMSNSAILNHNGARFAGRRASCLCCKKEWDIGNFTQHIKRKLNELQQTKN